MLKYLPDSPTIVLEEIPDMFTLAVDITGCQGKCEGCHSPYLRNDIGEELTEGVIDALLDDNFGVNCFLFLGEGNDRVALIRLADYIRSAHGIKTALYSGREDVEDDIYLAFDYVKTGPYIPSKGPLNKPATNQRLYLVEYPSPGEYRKTDITERFWHRGLDPNVNRK